MLQPGDRLRVRPGEKVPVDGKIVGGRSSLDEPMMTGESMPVSKEVGGKIIAGTLNRSGSFVMRAEKVGSDTMLSQIVQMVAQAQRSRAVIQRLADQAAGWFVPAVIVIAVAAFAHDPSTASSRASPSASWLRLAFSSSPVRGLSAWLSIGVQI